MLTITFNGPNSNFFDDAFFDPVTGDFFVNPVSATGTQLVVNNPATGVTTTITGTGFT